LFALVLQLVEAYGIDDTVVERKIRLAHPELLPQLSIWRHCVPLPRTLQPRALTPHCCCDQRSAEKQHVSAFLDGSGPGALRWSYQVG